jgi:hypothetical protein
VFALPIERKNIPSYQTMKCSSVHPSELYHECRYHQGCTNPGRQFAIATKFCVLASNNSGSSVYNLVHVTLLEA